MRLSAIIFLIFSSMQFISCSWMDKIYMDSPEAPLDQTLANQEDARAALANAEQAPETTPSRELTSIDLRWEAPGESVDIYHLYYGFTSDNLSEYIALPVNILEKVDSPAHGPVFHYQLENIPRGQEVYISLAAENSAGRSERSEAVKITSN